MANSGTSQASETISGATIAFSNFGGTVEFAATSEPSPPTITISTLSTVGGGG